MWLIARKIRAAVYVCFLPMAAGAQTATDSDNEQFEGLSAGVVVDIQSGEPVRLQRFDHDQVAITIDGHLAEDVWASLNVFDDFKVVDPDTLATPPYKTELRIFYTEKGIYASFDVEQPQETILRRFFARDDRFVSRDRAGLTLDTSGDGRYGFFIDVSVGDVQMDGTVLPERQFNGEWDGAWYGATQITERGWSAEFFLPWSQVAMPKQEGVRRIGLYAARIVAHLDQRWTFPPLPATQPRFISSFQPLHLEGIDPRQQWSVFPYGSATYDRVIDDVRYKAGADMFWRPSSNFQLTATVNPDFGAVEADEVVVNLTADEVFFPEKRLFFVEGQDIFNATPRAEAMFGQRFSIVNTRRIGASPREPDLPPGVSLPPRQELQLTDLLGAGKATGQLGSMRYGVLAAVEDDSEFTADDGLEYLQDGRDFGTFRLLYEDDKGASYRGLGYVTTFVGHPEDDAIVHALDFHRLSDSGVWNIYGQLAYSDIDSVGSGFGGFVDLEYSPRQGRTHTLQITAFDDEFDVNDFGFQLRNNMTDVRYAGEWVNSNIGYGRDQFARIFIRYGENGEGLRIRNMIGSRYQLTFDNLHEIRAVGRYETERFDDRNSFGNGTFEVEGAAFLDIEYETNKAKPVAVFTKMNYQDEALGGYSLTGAAGVTWRPVHNLELQLEAAYTDRNGWLLHQEDQNFTTFNSHEWQPGLNMSFFPSARQEFELALQWVGVRAREDEFYVLPDGSTTLVPVPRPPGPSDDFNISDLSFQIRYRWQIAPLSDLFIVYTKGDSRETDTTDFDDIFSESSNMPLVEFLIIKLRYRFGS